MTWRLAKSLEKLRAQVNAAVPTRKKDSDGSIGDEAHASRTSDHNPYIKDKNGVGVVRAIDITHDPAGGFDSYKFADYLRSKKDKRIRYVISNRRIWSPSVSPAWRAYNGSNPHNHHVHISVSENASLYDDTSDWDIGLGAKPAQATAQPVNKPSLISRLFSALAPKTVAKPVDALERVMPWVFEDEGGVTISPDEPGGISTYGVSRTAYSEYTGRKVSVAEMKALTKDQAAKFYREKYWNTTAPDKPAGVRYAIFDWKLNSGSAALPPLLTVDSICDARIARLRALATWPKYGKGWTNRITRVRQRAKTL